MLVKQLRWVLASGLIVVIALALASCDPEPKEQPPTIPDVTENTLQPPFITQTPQYTATLTPSMTFTPSTTPTASDTPTPVTPSPTVTSTPTPPAVGVVDSSDNVRLREGPGQGFPEIASFKPGTQVQILYSDQSAINEMWYRVRVVDDEGTIQEGWMLGRLVDTQEIIPTAGPTPTPTVGVTIGSPAPFATAEVSGTPIQFNTGTPPADLSEVNIWAYCDEYNGKAMSLFPRSATSDQTVSIYWSWYVTRPELMADHIAAVDYNVTVNGSRLENWQQYAAPMRRDPRNNNNWTVYWYIPLGKLTPGEYTVNYRATWSKVVNDGLQDYGPDTTNTEDVGTCKFTITE